MTSPRRSRKILVTLLAVALAPLTVLATADPGAAGSGATVSGKVEADWGLWLKGISVDIYRRSGAGAPLQLLASKVTDSQGDYEFRAVPAGDYVLHFEESAEDPAPLWDFLPEYWNDATDVADAAAITVLPGADVGGIDAVLTSASRIRGNVVALDGQGRGDVVVKAWRLDPTTSVWDVSAQDVTKADGTYDIRWLREGTYRLEFVDGVYGTEWWTVHWRDYTYDVDQLALASDIVLSTGVTIVDENAQLGTPPPVTLVQASPARIGGTPEVGETLYADPGLWSPLPEHIYVQWLADDEPVAGATDYSYVPVPDDIGKSIQFSARITRTGFPDGHTVSPPTGAVAPEQGPAPWNTAPPYIVGTPRVGVAVSANPGAWDLAGSTMEYQWTVDDVPVVGATHARYTPVPADVGKKLRVDVTAKLAGHADGVQGTPGSRILPGPIKPSSYPRVRGRAERGATLVVDPGTWKAEHAKVTVQWYAGPDPIARATSKRLELTGRVADAVTGKGIGVRISVTAPGYLDESVTLKVPGRVRRPAAARASTPTVTNLSKPSFTDEWSLPGYHIAQVGALVTADPGTWNPAHSSFGYQWLIDGVPIEGATGPTYTPVQADLNRPLQLAVTASKAGYVDGVATSDPVYVWPARIVVTKNPDVEGVAMRGATLTLKMGEWTPTDSAVRIQWYANRDQIPWATSTTLNLVGRTAAAVRGKLIKVRIWLTAPGDSASTVRFTISVPGRVR